MFKLSEKINTKKVFLVNRSELEGYFSPLFFKTKPKPVSHNKRLKDIALVNPTRPRPKFDAEELVPYVGLPETDENDYSIKEVVLRPYKEVAGRNVIYPNEILYARIEPSIFNKKYILTRDLKGYDFAFTSTEFYVVQGEQVSNEYLFYCLLTDYVYDQAVGKTTGSTGRRRLDPEVFRRLQIPVPQPEIQEKVVVRFKEAYAQKQQKEAQAKKLLAGIDEYLLNELGIALPQKDNSLANRIFKTSFQKVTGNRFDPKLYDIHSQRLFQAIEDAKYLKVPLKHLIIQSFAGDWGLDENKEVSEQDYKRCMVIRATEFDNDFNLNIENSRAKYRKIKTEKLTKLDIQPNDLLIEKSGGSPDQPVGRISILTKELVNNNNLCYSNFIHKIRVDTEKVYPEYLFCYLKTIHNIKVTEIMQSQTNGIRNLIMREYLNQSIVLPDNIEKQQHIAKEANKMRYEAQRLQREAKQELENARKEVEKMILNEEKNKKRTQHGT